MRNSGLFVIVAFALMLSVSAIGQPEGMVDLAVEPVRSPITNTLADAARHHNFPAFDSMYRNAANRPAVAAFDELHSLWTWAMNDPIGAFYGSERHARYARMFPGYAQYIEDYRIVDANGNSFYPTAETRAFLLEQALKNVRPVVVAEKTAEARSQESAAASAATAGETPAPHKATPPPAPARIASTQPARSQQRAATSAAPAGEAPALHKETPPPAPARIETRATSVPAPIVAPAPVHISEPVEDGPSSLPPASMPQGRSGLGRGIFMIIAGLFGVGMITLMLQTPATRS